MLSPRALGLGLELPVPRPSSSDHQAFGLLAVLVEAAESAGFGSVWLRGASSSAPGGVDPVPLVGALAERTRSLRLGVACAGCAGRHPAILARDITSIDVLSAGRAALSLSVAEAGPAGPARLIESAQICRLLFSAGDGATTFSGKYFSVRFAPNRPTPRQADGPPLLVDLPTETGGAGFDALIAAVDAVVVDGPVDAVAEGRQRLEGSARSSGIARPRLVWRASPERALADCAPLVKAATGAGADSVIIRLSDGGVPTADGIADAARALLPILGRAA
jgi:alkanesulfonate monooxygenase SsuD/methylene tetrahydromethanopterin reductase-like flavin-dependent oxidoreductase (luciferase family)